MPRTVGIVGARGFVGSELIRLIAGHPEVELAFVSSRERANRRLDEHEAGYEGDLTYVDFGPDECARHPADAIILALPNGHSEPFVAAIDRNEIIVDVSADHRFVDDWAYGLPELGQKDVLRRAKRIANPGCYATAMQLALAPVVDLLDGPAQCFGVSGWSGAGASPSDKNDPDKLRDNLLPYSLIGHIHERESTRFLRHPVELMPHVASHFRGLGVTTNAHLKSPVTRDALVERFEAAYASAPLVRVRTDPPWMSRVAGRHHAEVGGFTLSSDGRRLVIVSALDNLLKGAATQAIQNLNLALGLEDTLGIPGLDS
ncbi:MAG: N-acetyl-gamma-glutamyl-phosphate reductase [Deltaproteobacteria bacterium]|nr:N-acetyl-gamma-glutamyl-phosphate reductase [Deltaproteobacteria bacterium]